MRRSYLLAVLLSLSIVAGSVWWIGRDTPPVLEGMPAPGGSGFEDHNASAPVPGKSIAQSPERSRPADRLSDQLLTAIDIVETARSLNAPDATIHDDLEILHSLLAFFRQLNHGKNPPGGLNEEIVDQLRGKNAKRFAVLPPDLPSINADGQLLDRWGTPFYFHPVSGTEMEVRSAGPDRRFWTVDDVE